MLQNRSLVQYYTNKNIGVSYLRAKKRNDLDRVMALYCLLYTSSECLLYIYKSSMTTSFGTKPM